MACRRADGLWPEANNDSHPWYMWFMQIRHAVRTRDTAITRTWAARPRRLEELIEGPVEGPVEGLMDGKDGIW